MPLFKKKKRVIKKKCSSAGRRAAAGSTKKKRSSGASVLGTVMCDYKGGARYKKRNPRKKFLGIF